MQRFMQMLQHWTPLQVTENKVVPVKEVVTLPVFPEFKKLTLDDRHIIEEFVKDHPPYSDFNFTSLWCYNVDNLTSFSFLNGNLVIRLRDYIEQSINYTFLGRNKVKDTIEQIFALNSDSKNNIKLIPEINFANISSVNIPGFSVIEDPHQSDYIYDIHKLSTLEDSSYKKKRNMYRRFIKDHVSSVNVCSLNTLGLKQNLMDVISQWRENKPKGFEINEHESIALDNIFHLKNNENIKVLLVTVGGKISAFSISEIIHDGHAIMHFQKANYKYTGINEYLMSQTAQCHKENNIFYLNYEQDLGIEGLKSAKKMWNPIKMMKKYSIYKSIH